MQVSRHIGITGGALKQWFIAQCYDSACVGLLWWAGLTALHVPWAPFWGLLAAMLQFIPQFGTVLSFFGPALAAMFVGWETMLYVLILYARVPIWASLTVPIFLSLIFGFWGVLLAAPLLAVIFAYRALARSRAKPTIPQQTPPGQVITGGQLISPGDPSERIPRGE